ncbi:MAG TPA: phage head closure protein [Fervidobacterium sp.]|nr:phage head closure protein [Fervidobacterium sp.]
MRKDKIVYLISETETTNAMGDVIIDKLYRKTFAAKKSIRQSEYYQAAATGLRPELTFVLWTREYKGEKSLKYDDKEYTIIRTFEPNSEEIELVCQGVVNRADA